jgi:dedicator of cytokinesis protein 3
LNRIDTLFPAAWGELIKVGVPVETMQECHLFLSFRTRNIKGGSDVPFAFAYFPLCVDDSAFQTDGSHNLVLYKYDRQIAVPSFYFQVPSVYNANRQIAPLPPSVSRTLFPLKDSVVVLRSFLVSTTYTQNETLLRLLKWESQLLPNPELMKDTLTKLRWVSSLPCTSRLSLR